MLEILAIQLCVLFILAAFQPTEERRYAAAVFVGITIFHHIAAYYAEGWGYYFSAGVADAAIVVLTIRLKITSRVIDTIHTICYVSILMNFIGWIMWMSYLPHHAYNAAFLLIYGWAIINLSRKEQTNDGAIAMGMGHHHVFPSASKSHYSDSK